MLSLFPSFLNYALLGPFLLRLVLGLIFIDLGLLKFKGEKQRWLATFETLRLRPTHFFVPLYGFVQVVGGFLLVIGLWTQGAALLFAILTFCELYMEWTSAVLLKRDLTFYLLIFVISLAILVMGAGAYSFDIPL
jgi:uncharacterized membrane protein YphA (DoxX/SURF4 family)